jgi:hypothetical protein
MRLPIDVFAAIPKFGFSNIDLVFEAQDSNGASKQDFVANPHL